MASYATDDPVDVRHDTGQAWLPGTVTNPCPDHPTGCWLVTLDADCTADAWTGTTRRYGGSDNLTDKKVHVKMAADINGLTEGELIRTQGG